MSQRDLILALDAGTSVVKAALFDAHGTELAVARRRTTPISPRPGWSEVSMEETWLMACAAMQQVLQEADANRVVAVGITGQMVGAWLIDEAGDPVRTAILWNDNRAQPLIAELSARHPDFMREIYLTSGSVMQQGCTLPVLAWLQAHDPSALERATTVLCCKDWIAHRLTGTRQVDPTEASVMPGDLYRRGYSDSMLDLFGLRRYERLFPPIRDSQSIVGVVHETAARATGLPVGIPVVAGAGDVPASVLGLGAVETGAACTLLGTNVLNCLIIDSPRLEPMDVGLHFVMPGAGWLRAMVNVSGTTSLDWFICQFCGEEVAAAASATDLYDRLEELARESGTGARGLLYLPYLSLQGITAPVAEPSARAEFFGLTNMHTRGDMLRALYEGVALSIRDGYEVMNEPVTAIRLSGGGAKSAFWSQLIADCTARTVIVPAGNEFGAKGAALLTMTALDWHSSLADAVESSKGSQRTFKPNPERAKRYEEVYAVYRALRHGLRNVWQQAAHRFQQDGPA